VLDINTLTDLYKHMQWADATVWSAVLASDDTQSDETLRTYFYHLHLVQRAFLSTWRSESHETPYPRFDDTPSLMQWGQTYYSEAMGYLNSLREEQLSEAMPLAWAGMVEQRLGRAPEITTIGETILQVALHSQYHRGQINAQLRRLGVEPPLVDYIAWVWQGRPKAEWPGMIV
jgi:uncharacterized damage-inducible protein DinB